MRLVRELLMALTLAGLSLNAAAQTPTTRARIHPPTVFAGPCVWTSFETGGRESALSALGDALLGGIIGQTTTNIGAALKSAAAERTFAATGTVNVDSIELRAARCVQIWSGPLAQSSLAASASPGPWIGMDGEMDLRLHQAGIHPTGRPDFFVELWLRPSSDGNYVAVTPTLLFYGDSLESGRPATRNRELTVLLSSVAPGKPAAAARVSLGLQGRTERVVHLISRDQFQGSCVPPPPSPLPPVTPTNSGQATVAPVSISNAPRTGDAAGSNRADTPPVPVDCSPNSGIVEAAWMGNPAVANLPLTFTVSIEEVRPRNPVLMFVSQIFDGSRDELNTVLQQTLIESEREKARRETEAAQATAYVAASTSYSAAETKRQEYCTSSATGPARETLAALLFQAKVKANADARLAGLGIPYADVQLRRGPTRVDAECPA